MHYSVASVGIDNKESVITQGGIIMAMSFKNELIEELNEIFQGDTHTVNDVLSAIAKRNVTADKINLGDWYDMVYKDQHIFNLNEIAGEATNFELVVRAGSNLIVLLADTEDGLDIYVWNIRSRW